VPSPEGGAISPLEWQLNAYFDGSSLVPVPDEVLATALFGLAFIDDDGNLQTFDNGSLTGSTGCHQYLAQVAVDRERMTVSDLTITLGACGSPAVDVENAMLEDLFNAASYTATPESLTIFGPEGGVLLAFVPGPTAAVPSPSAEATPTAKPTPTPTPAGRQARITDIRVRNGRYIVEYEVFGYRQELPGRHVHFFFDTVPQREAGVPGGGPWILYAGPSPFTQYSVSDRPASATQMCILVANPDHSINRGTGNCVDLPR